MFRMPYTIIEKICIKSGECIKECPMDAITYNPKTDRYTIDPDLCMDCGSCADVCPSGAITGVSDE